MKSKLRVYIESKIYMRFLRISCKYVATVSELSVVELVVSSVEVVCTYGELIKSGFSFEFMIL